MHPVSNIKRFCGFSIENVWNLFQLCSTKPSGVFYAQQATMQGTEQEETGIHKAEDQSNPNEIVSSTKLEFDRYFKEFDNARGRLEGTGNHKRQRFSVWMSRALELTSARTQELVDTMDLALLNPDPEKHVASYTVQEIKRLPDILERIQAIPEGIGLRTLQLRKADLLKEDDTLRRYYGHLYLHTADGCEESWPSGRTKQTAVDPSEVVFAICVYHPKRDETEPKLSVKLQVLGSQNLWSVRDLIKCQVDLGVTDDVSENPKGMKPKTAKEKDSSGCICIEDVLYMDDRCAEMDLQDVRARYSKWTSYPSERYERSSMVDTSLRSLNLRLGRPYLYIHQKTCEHAVIFTDAWLHNPTVGPVSPKEAYPLIVRNVRARAKKCMLCRKYIAKWITRGNDRVPCDPFLYCEWCFFKFNYDKHDKKVGKFKAYPYYDKRVYC